MQYVKIKEAIVEQINLGTLAPRQKLPAERKFAEMFDTTRVTLREALSLLEAEGKIYREDRRGWFISPESFSFDPGSKASFTRQAIAQSRIPKIDVLAAKSLLATKLPTSLLELPPFSDVHQLKRVYSLEERPVAYVENYNKPKMCPNFLNNDLSRSLSEIFKEEYGIDYSSSRYKISSTSLFGELALALRATAGTPALLIERVNYDQNGQIIDCDVEYWRHDAVCIESIVQLA